MACSSPTVRYGFLRSAHHILPPATTQLLYLQHGQHRPQELLGVQIIRRQQGCCLPLAFWHLRASFRSCGIDLFVRRLQFLDGSEILSPQLVAVASRSLDPAQAFALENGFEKAYALAAGESKIGVA